MTIQARTILFSDDEPARSVALRLALEGRGYICVSTENATEAWKYLESSPVDVLVTDIMMAAGDSFPFVDSSVAGFHLVKEVRKRFRNVSIICLSVIADVDKIEELKMQGVQYLRKGETPLATALQLIEAKATGIFRG